jgi:hypothetical protein
VGVAIKTASINDDGGQKTEDGKQKKSALQGRTIIAIMPTFVNLSFS